MNEELEKIIRSYKITLGVFCFVIIFMICLFSWVIVRELPEIVSVAVAQALSDRFDNVEVTQ